jgi:hypothetical protein
MENDSNPVQTPVHASMTKREYAKRQSVSERTLDNWRQRGMPFLLVSARKVLFPVVECDAWVREEFLIYKGRKGSVRSAGKPVVL